MKSTSSAITQVRDLYRLTLNLLPHSQSGLTSTCLLSDRHDDPDVVEYRKEYTTTMEKLEERCAIWAHLTEAEYLKLKQKQPQLKHTRCISIDRYEFHVDDSEAFLAARLDIVLGGAFRDDFDPSAKKPSPGDWAGTCNFRHTYDACRCHRPAISLGQDESIFKAHQQSAKVWKFNGCGGLRKKSEGELTCYSCSISLVPLGI